MAVRGNLAGVRFRLECDSIEFERYAEVHLRALGRADPDDDACDVSAELRWHEGQPPSSGAAAARLDGFERLDRDLYVNGRRLHWFRVDDLRDLHMYAERTDDGLHVEGDFYFRVGNHPASNRLRRLLQPSTTASHRRRRFTTLLSYLVYYPCWFWLESSRGYHPIHAGAVSTDDGVVLLPGASGVGKSTLSVALSARPGNRYLSDSFVVHRGTDVLAVREPTLLDNASIARIGSAAGLLEKESWKYVLGRSGYDFEPERLAEGGRASCIVFPHRAPKPFLRKLTATEAHAWISASGMMTGDMRRYWAFAAVFERIADCGGLVSRREQAVAELTAAVPAWELGLAPGASIEDSLRAVASVQAGSPRPASEGD